MISISSRQSMNHRIFVTLLFLIIGGVGIAAHAETENGPTIMSVGAIPDVPGAMERPDPKLNYKLVMDIQMMGDSPDDTNPAIEFLGGIINTLRKGGVAKDHIHVTAVFHGKTIVLVTRDSTYRNRTGASNNPNIKILNELAAAGVDLVVCGQSAGSQHYSTNDLLPVTKLNLSATLTFINLQTRGYTKVED
jgi:intracellular sulfur oxidation DsrE/DsrF family protein